METAIDNIGLVLGIGLCGLVGLLLAAWTLQAFQRTLITGRQSMLQLRQTEIRIRAAERRQQSDPLETLKWSGYRRFRVQKITAEAHDVVSIYLTPVDGQALAPYLPGQYLTIRFPVPGYDQPLTRCYSLSDRPNGQYYRCTIKRIKPQNGASEQNSRVVSRYVHDCLQPGDVLQCKAPSGTFVLDDDHTRPVILVAAGVGVTPFISMINSAVDQLSGRQLILFFGVRNGHQHLFREHLSRLQQNHENIHVVTCYSQPLAEDQVERDFDIPGRISINLLQRVLPSSNYEFYVCGPGPFMDSIVAGLTQWGVPQDHVHLESFGTTKSITTKPPAVQSTANSQVMVHFAQTGKSVPWSDDCESLLELAESSGVPMMFGCRQGNCGACETQIQSGKISYTTEPQVAPDEGSCLVCVARPDGPLTLDA